MLEELVRAVQESARYRNVCPDVIRRIGARQLSLRRSLKEAIKETKNTLHQAAGAFSESKRRYPEWLESLRNARDAGDDAFRAACRERMASHASTEERLGTLETFYATTLADIAPVRSILDLACGLNPLAIPWMPLAPDAVYTACDLYTDLADFLNAFLPMAGVSGQAFPCDVLSTPPLQEADLAFVLKFLPLMEQWDKSASGRLLRELRVRHILVSYPTRSLGGRGKGMAENYAARFQELVQGEPWQIRRTDFPNELAFLITKSPPVG